MQTSINQIPIGDRILVLRDPVVTTTPGGLELAKEAQDIPVEGTVIALGTAHDDGLKCPVKAGDRVTFTEYTGTTLKVGKKDDVYLIMRPDELLSKERVQGSPMSSSAAA